MQEKTLSSDINLRLFAFQLEGTVVNMSKKWMWQKWNIWMN